MDQVEGVRAELESIIGTADLIAHDGLQPDADGFRVMAGLISQLANQMARLIDVPPRAEGGSHRAGKPDQRAARTEEDITPEDAPAQPSREI